MARHAHELLRSWLTDADQETNMIKFRNVNSVDKITKHFYPQAKPNQTSASPSSENTAAEQQRKKNPRSTSSAAAISAKR